MFNPSSKVFLSLPNVMLEKILLVLSSLLLSIWLMRGTIALRNILLVTCAILSIFYLVKNFHELFVKIKIPLKNWMPIILIGLLFIWVLIHLFFFSYEPILQLKELSSTWLRSFMACIIGFTIGLIVNKNPNRFNWLMFALISGFLILFYQYVGLVWQSGNLFQQMWWVSIYWGKINQVLLGTLFIGGSLAFYENSYSIKNTANSAGELGSEIFTKSILYLLGILLALHCFVFEIDTRNGIGISTILLIIFFLRFIWSLLARAAHGKSHVNWQFAAVLVLLLTIMGFFAYQQTQKNIGWKNPLEDMQISAQVDQYKNWQVTPAAPVYTPAGRLIPLNTYERTAWMIVAAQVIHQRPWGYGLLHNSFGRTIKLDIPSSDLTASHNGWLDFGLSFGVIGLVLLLGSLLSTLGLSFSSNGAMRLTIFWSSISLLLCYTLGELMVYHGMEFLIFWLSLLPMLLFEGLSKTNRVLH